MVKGWSDTKPVTSTKWQDLLDWYKFKEPKSGEDGFNHLRLIGPIMSACYHWVDIKKPDGSKTAFPMTCAGYNPETETTDPSKCPACQAEISQQKFYFQNAIIRTEQENKPAKVIELADCPEEAAKEYRSVSDKHWSPVKVVKIPISCASQLRDIVNLNKHNVNGRIKSMDISDPKYGCDIFIKYDSKEAPANKYNVQKGDASPLTEEERQYKLYNLNIVSTDAEKMKNDLIRLGRLKGTDVKNNSKLDLSIDDDDELPAPPSAEYEGEETLPKSKDKLSSLNRAQLELLNKKKKWGIDTSGLNDDELRATIRCIIKNAACFGKYLAEDKCFRCKVRGSCIVKSE